MRLINRKLVAAIAGGGAWQPSDLGSALYQFYDPSNAGSLTLSGNEVTQVNDLSGNGFNLTPAGTGPDAASGVRTINGNVCFDFVATSSEYLVNRSVTGYGNIGDNWIFAFVAVADSSIATNTGSLAIDNSDKDFQLEAGISSSFYYTYRSTNLGGLAASSTDFLSTVAVVVVIFDVTAGTVTVRGNGSQIAQSATYTGGFLTTNYEFIFGNNRGEGSPFDGGVGPILVVSVSDSESITNIETWLANWAGVTLP